MEEENLPQVTEDREVDPLRLFFTCNGFRGMNASRVKQILEERSLSSLEDVNKIASRANGFALFSTAEKCQEFLSKMQNEKYRDKDIIIKSAFLRPPPATDAPPKPKTQTNSANQQNEEKDYHFSPKTHPDTLPTILEIQNRKFPRGLVLPIADKVSPLHRFPYHDQIAIKQQYVKTLLKKATRQHYEKHLKSSSPPLWSLPWINKGFHGCNLQEPLLCPEEHRNHYRNKIEMTFGFGIPHKESDYKPYLLSSLPSLSPPPVSSPSSPSLSPLSPLPSPLSPLLGFVNTLHQGNPYVSPIDTLAIVTEEMSALASLWNDFLSSPSCLFPVFDRQKKEGCWRLCMIRQSPEGLLVTFQVTPPSLWGSLFPDLSVSEKRELLHQTILSLLSLPSSLSPPLSPLSPLPSPILGVLIQESEEASDALDENKPIECIYGQESLLMKIFDVQFNVKPLSFFQTNVPAFQVLLDTALSFIQQNTTTHKKKVILDLCCGTGTIGLCLLSRLGEREKDSVRVIGIDIVESAIVDARRNAERNLLSDRVTYLCGRVEEHLDPLLQELAQQIKQGEIEQIVAIVDPPRVGLHNSVLRSLKECEFLDTLLYISCNPVSLCENLVPLCERSEKESLSPWAPLLTYIEDGFPHTLHIETLMILRRENTIPAYKDITPEHLAQLKQDMDAFIEERDKRQGEERLLREQAKKARTN